MGCFNIIGFHTHLPLVYGDKAVLFLGVHSTYKNGKVDRDFMEFSPGSEFTPIALPVFGEYDDYGRIHNVKRDANVDSIEKYFGQSIDTIISIVDNAMVDRYMNNDEIETYQKMCDKIASLQPQHFVNLGIEREYKIVFTIDHAFMYDTIKTLDTSCYDFHTSYDELLKFCAPWEKLHRDEDVYFENETKWENGEIDEYNYELIKCKNSYMNQQERWFQFLNKGKYPWNKGFIVDISPNPMFRGFWYYSESCDRDAIMCVYHDDENAKCLFFELKDAYIDFLSFVAEFKCQQWCFRYHNYGSQETNCKNSIKYYQAMLKHCEVKMAKECEYEDE